MVNNAYDWPYNWLCAPSCRGLVLVWNGMGQKVSSREDTGRVGSIARKWRYSMPAKVKKLQIVLLRSTAFDGYLVWFDARKYRVRD